MRREEMYRLGFTAKIIGSVCFAAICAVGLAAQSQPDSQAGAQLGKQSALGGKQAQGANTQKTTATSPNALTTTDVKSADGRTILPRGAKIIGHVTQASARNAGQPDSSLGLVFDKAILKNGQEIPLNAGVQALGAPPSSSFDTNQAPARDHPVGASPGAPGYGSQGASRGNGGMNGTPSASAPNRADDPYSGGANPPDAGNASTGQWDANTRGVVGLHNLNLNTAGGSDGQGSVITSTGKNVRLDSGTRLLLVTGAVPSH